MLQNISISNKCCSFELSINQRSKSIKQFNEISKKYEAAQLFSTLIIIQNIS